MSGFRCPNCSAAQTVEAVERVAGRVVCRTCGASTSLEVSDPLGVGDAEHLDLPAPKSRFADLPAPRGATPGPSPLSGGAENLPAPVFRGKSRGIDNLPAPRGASPPPIPGSAPIGGHQDLPAPKQRPAMPDLLAPVGSASPPPLPSPPSIDPFAPSAAADLPAPKGFFEDAVAPKNDPFGAASGGPADLPAPKGFFDDAVAPKNDPFGAASGGPADLPAPKGFFDDAVAPKDDPFAASGGPADLPAPKGFFDDAVAPKDDLFGAGGPTDLPAPKGFFDDAVAPSAPGSAPAPAAPGGLPAPKGIFDDLAPPQTMGGAADAGFDLGEPLDLGAPLGAPGPSASAPAAGGLDLGAPMGQPFGDSLDLSDPIGGSGGLALDGLELGAPEGLDLGSAQAQPLDLGGPGAPPLDLGGPGAAPLDLGQASPMDPGEQKPFGLDDLELEAPALGPRQPPSDTGSAFEGVALPGATVGPSAPPPPSGDGVVSFSSPSEGAVAAGQQGFSRRRPPESQQPLELDDSPLPVEQAAEARKTLAQERRTGTSIAPPVEKKNRTRAILVAVLGVAVLGGGGFFGYTKWAASQSKGKEVKSAISEARKHLLADRPGHWDAAVNAAKRALSADNKNADALALSAQALFASAIDSGVGRQGKIAQGKKLMVQLRQQAAKGPEVHKAEGLQAVVENRGGDAIKQLTAAKGANARDSSLDLYLGWAQLLIRNFPIAEKSFGAALKSSPGRVAAHYGLGRAQQEQGKIKEARASYAAAIEKSRERYKSDHVGALVGAAELAEVERFTDRENRYLEILARGELAKLDPRAIARAWTLAADEALRAGRLQEATQRYAKALELDAGSRAAVIGEGKTLLAQRRFTDARERLTRVLGIDPNNLDANLTLAEVALRQEKVTEAKQLVGKVLDRKPPVIDKVLLSNAHRVLAGAYALEPRDAEAESEYREAIKLSSEHDIRAALDLANFFVSRERGDEAKEVLEPIRARADTDPGIGVSLGVAYLGAGDALSSEQTLRKALELRPGDPEARYQLGRALLAQKRTDEGLAAIKAAYDSNKDREDIGLALAIAYEQKKRFKDASSLYESLLSAEKSSLNVKASAGRYFARHDKIARAIALGEEILTESKDNPAGLFLLGEKHFQANEFDKAQRAYLDAASFDKEAQYLEGAGRAAEKQRNFDDAIRHYENVLKIEPDYLSALYGQARIHLGRRAFSEAISALDRAIALEAKDAWPFAARGTALIELGKLKEGVTSLARAVKIDPELAEAHYRLGRAYYDLDKARASAVALGRATSKATGDEPWLTEAYRVLGYAHRMARNRAGAIKAFRAYLARDPEKGPQRSDAKRELLFLEGGGR